MSEPNRPTQSLIRMLGLTFGLAVTVGNTIGAGILRTPGEIAGYLPNSFAFVGIWVIGGLYALLGANALAELGTMMPRSGGQYVFAHDIFGDYVGFVVGWMDWISTCASTAAIATVIGESAVRLAGASSGVAAVAMLVVAAFTFLLFGGTKRGDRVQQLTSLLKSGVLIGLVIACFAFGGRTVPPSTAAATTGAGGAIGFAGFLLAAQSVIYAYDGWNGPIYFSEELHDPARQIPRGMFYGLAGVATIYLLINLAFLHAVPLSALAGSKLAAGTVANAIFGAAGERIVQVLVVLSLPSAVNACTLMASRTLFSMSRDGVGIPVAARVSPRGTPIVSLGATGLVTLAFLATGTFETMIAIAAFFFVANYATSFLGLIRLRLREPNRARPYRTFGYPWTTVLVLLGSLAFLISAVVADRRNSLFALGILVVSYPVFRLTRPRAATLVTAE
ncbi:MAG TPA: APC family permease [Gemmatimonadaceae bacterium]|nr:APC family permease [Gemmatimonadaceae bacterium]